MATQLNDFSFTPAGRPSKYQWDQWANGKPWKLEAGTDFTISVESMRTAARAYAARRGLKVKTSVVDGRTALVLQFERTPKTKTN